MYLVLGDRLHGDKRSPLKKRKHHPYAKQIKKRKHHPYEEWVKMPQKMDEADIRKRVGTNAFADFLRRVMPISSEQASKASPPPPYQKTRRGTQTDITSASFTSPLPLIPSTSIKEFKYEPLKQERVYDDDYDDDNIIEDEPLAYGRENVGPVASPYLMPYVYKRCFLDTQYGVRKDGGMFMIGDSPIVVDTGGDITIKERVCKGSKGLWELLRRKKVKTEFITKDLKTCGKVFTMSNAHLTRYWPEGNMNITRGKKFRDVISPLFAKPYGRGVESALIRNWTKY